MSEPYERTHGPGHPDMVGFTVRPSGDQWPWDAWYLEEVERVRWPYRPAQSEQERSAGILRLSELEHERKRNT